MPPPSLDDRAVLLIVAAQHGGEPSGRDAVYALAQRLTTTTDPDELDFLANHGVLLWPTANPDRILLDRRNANAVDLNRQHVTLSEPEARALAVVLGRTRPAIVVDMHEAFPQDEEVSFAAPTNPMASPAMVQHSQDIITACKARATLEGWASGDYSPNTSERTLVNAAGLRHAAGVLVEVSQDGFDEDERITIATAMVEEIFAYAVDHAGELLSDADQSAADATAAGQAGTAPINLRTEVIDPPPLGYRVTVGDLATLGFHLQVFGIETGGPGGRQISLGQPAYPVIPFIVDPAAEFGTVAGVRLFSLEPDPPPPATVATLAPIVAGSHRMVVEALVLSEYQTGDDPEGISIPILGGEREMDGTADVQRTLNLVTGGVDFPRRIGDLLLPDGTEVFVRRGVDIGSDVLWAPLGYYRIEEPEQDDAPDGPIVIRAFDRMQGIITSPLLSPRQFGSSTTFGEVFSSLVSDVYPTAVIAWDDDTEHEPIGRALIVERSRYEPLRTLAESRGKILYWDGRGILRVETAPDPSEPLWEVRAGRDGVLSRARRRITRTDVVNAVVVRSQASSDLGPARAVAIDDGPQSITRFGGRFGAVPAHITVPVETTVEQARETARLTLLRRAGLPFQVEVESVPNPALKPFDPFRVTLRNGEREKHVAERITLPLTAQGVMRIASREQRGSLVRVVTT